MFNKIIVFVLMLCCFQAFSQEKELLPQFVVLQVEGNSEPQALSWILDVVKKRTNSDSSKIQMSFFVNGVDLNKSKKMLKKAYNRGNEIGNSTYSGFLDTAGEKIDASLLPESIWSEEISRNDSLIKKYLDIEKEKITGFLIPRSEYNDAALNAIRKRKFLYWEFPDSQWIVLKDGVEIEKEDALENIKLGFDKARETGLVFSLALTPALYVSKNGNYLEHRKIIEDALDYMLSFENVKFVTAKTAIELTEKLISDEIAQENAETEESEKTEIPSEEEVQNENN